MSARTTVFDVRTPAGLREGVLRASAVLRGGGLVAFPTETVYGLGANALDGSAVQRIFEAKGRPASNPLIVHVAHWDQVETLAATIPEVARRLAERFWPGPLTLVLPRRVGIPDLVTAGGPTVAVRIPSHPVAQALLRACGLPIAAPSANRSNRLSPTRVEHVLRDLEGRIELILEGGSAMGGIESTVLDITDRPRLLRPGLIDPGALEAVVGPIERGQSGDEAGTLRSPGMLARHYAPRTRLEVSARAAERVHALSEQGMRVGLVTHEPTPPGDGIVATLPRDAVGYAAALYATLHALDEQNLERIVVAEVPAGDAWLGVRDRLRRAAAEG